MDITKSIQEYLGNAGMGDVYSQALLVVVLMVFFSIMLYKLDAPATYYILVNAFLFILAIVLEMIPMWIMLLTFMIVFAYGLLVLFDMSPTRRGD